MKGKILFKEEQSFVGTWIFYLFIAISTLSIGGAAMGLMHTNKPGSYVGLIIAVIVAGVVLVLFIISKLHLIVDEQAIYYRYPPFVNSEKKLTQNDIKEVFVRTYSPIWEYGGWGYRVRLSKGKALNVSGNQGLQLILKDGKKLLIGTRKAKSLESVIRRLKDNWEMNG